MKKYTLLFGLFLYLSLMAKAQTDTLKYIDFSRIHNKEYAKFLRRFRWYASLPITPDSLINRQTKRVEFRSDSMLLKGFLNIPERGYFEGFNESPYGFAIFPRPSKHIILVLAKFDGDFKGEDLLYSMTYEGEVIDSLKISESSRSFPERGDEIDQVEIYSWIDPRYTIHRKYFGTTYPVKQKYTGIYIETIYKLTPEGKFELQKTIEHPQQIYDVIQFDYEKKIFNSPWE